jgi:hypothetical protein
MKKESGSKKAKAKVTRTKRAGAKAPRNKPMASLPAAWER